MLAIVSMAFVSCGGGGVKLADPAIQYSTSPDPSQHHFDIKDCLKVQDVAISVQGSDKVLVACTVELVKEPSQPISSVNAALVVLDKNNVEIGRKWGYFSVSKKGDVSSTTFEISNVECGETIFDRDYTVSDFLKDAKFVRLEYVRGYYYKSIFG